MEPLQSLAVVRPFQSHDDAYCQEIIRDHVMRGARGAFFSCLFREITIQLIVLCWAIGFIFLGIPLFLCFLSIPVVLVMMGVSVYTSYFGKAMELSSVQPKHCWVAEIYEPFGLEKPPKNMEYILVPTESLQSRIAETNLLRRKMVGTISLKTHNTLDHSMWMYRMAVHSDYPLRKISSLLINECIKSCRSSNLYSIECVQTECQGDDRECILGVGFQIKQIYHKTVFGSLNIMHTQMKFDLSG